MKCKGKFKFKSLDKKDGGEFVNSRGQSVTYAGSYALKLDEQTEKGIFERVFKISLDNAELINSLSLLKPYDDIVLEFEINFYSSGIKLVPIAIVK